jgi:hypothetical protein
VRTLGADVGDVVILGDGWEKLLTIEVLLVELFVSSQKRRVTRIGVARKM